MGSRRSKKDLTPSDYPSDSRDSNTASSSRSSSLGFSESNFDRKSNRKRNKRNKKSKKARKHIKLPAVNMNKFKWNGTATVIYIFIKKWQHDFTDVPDNKILPNLEDLMRPIYQRMIFCPYFKYKCFPPIKLS